MLGKETIDIYHTSDTRGNNPAYGVNYQKIGRELFTPDELARLPGDKCILQIKGVKPFYSSKYDREIRESVFFCYEKTISGGKQRDECRKRKSVNQLRKIMDEGDELRKFIRPKEAIRIYSLSRTFIEEIHDNQTTARVFQKRIMAA